MVITADYDDSTALHLLDMLDSYLITHLILTTLCEKSKNKYPKMKERGTALTGLELTPSWEPKQGPRCTARKVWKQSH